MRDVTTWKWYVIAAMLGMGTYYLEWIELVFPTCCQHWPDWTIFRMYLAPVLFAAILGLLSDRRPFICWALFMIPSWVVRLIMLVKTGGNLWPPLAITDFVHLLITGAVFLGAFAWHNRRRMGGSH